jgi:hypothetical protein
VDLRDRVGFEVCDEVLLEAFGILAAVIHLLDPERRLGGSVEEKNGCGLTEHR